MTTPFARACILALALSGVATAQHTATITIDEPVLTQGEDTLVEFEHTTLTNTTITITVERTGTEEQETFEIQLDGNGYGAADYAPPLGWDNLTFRHPDASSVSRAALPN